MSTDGPKSFCEIINGGQEACMALARPIAILRAATDFASDQIAQGLSKEHDVFELGQLQARLGAAFMSSIMNRSGNSALEESADRAVPPEMRCPTCPIRLACQPPEVPDILPPEV